MHRAAHPENCYLAMARLKKAIRLLSVLTPDSRLTASLMAQAPAAWWEMVAKKAGVHPPSPETVALVLEMAREQETDRRVA